MTHAERILSLPSDTPLYDIHSYKRYIRGQLEPLWTNKAKTKASQALCKLSGHYVELNLLRPVGEKAPWLKPRIWGDTR